MLLVEILTESKRRYYQFDTKTHETGAKLALKEEDEDFLEEDDPLYDRVPSDEDYASVASESSSCTPVESKKRSKKYDKGIDQSPLSLNCNHTSPVDINTSRSARSNKTTPSPSSSKLKVLTTNFDKPNFNRHVIIYNLST